MAKIRRKFPTSLQDLSKTCETSKKQENQNLQSKISKISRTISTTIQVRAYLRKELNKIHDYEHLCVEPNLWPGQTGDVEQWTGWEMIFWGKENERKTDKSVAKTTKYSKK